tara:strand:- start:59 stop:481 length:423 start_codon:yes stop_codon:yes gene_type:complete
MKINFYNILLTYLPLLTFIFGVFHLLGDCGRQSGFGQLWNIGLFIALLSQQYCQRKGSFKFHLLLSNYNLNSDISTIFGYFLGLLLWGASSQYLFVDILIRYKDLIPSFIEPFLYLIGIFFVFIGSFFPFYESKYKRLNQ